MNRGSIFLPGKKFMLTRNSFESLSITLKSVPIYVEIYVLNEVLLVKKRWRLLEKANFL